MASDTRVGLRKVIAASLIGTTIEWYDFFLYGSAAALVFGKLFFPKADPLTGILLAFATNALGFFARPLGGLVFGHFGDRIGRKRLLMFSLILMGVSSMLIGCLPTYGQIGLAAPLMLIALRLVQGFAVGGEWGGAVLIVAEHGPPAGRGFWTSWPQAGVAAGNLVATAVLLVMAALQSEADFLAWGWRLPFLLSVGLIAIGWWIRSSIAESPVFAQAAAAARAERAPAIEAIRTRPRALLTGAGLRMAENICYYIITTFSIVYLTEQVHLTRLAALRAILIGSAVQFCAIPLFGMLSDKIGRRPVYAIGAAGTGLWAFAFFNLLATGATPLVIAAIVVGLIFHAAMYGPQAAFICEMFPTRIRYSGASLSYQATSIVAGSLAPIIAVAILHQTQSALGVSIYVGAAAAISFVAALVAKETRGKTFAEIDAEA
ncbi:MFS transporter [Phenylobacterium sp.]|uniref:MFS transporter n=1 Tax=Phenylobacterium sp. TaxID=1871053 RepID=UPI0025CF1729|nr:MFS transporter [Phenylobacterium sp.]